MIQSYENANALEPFDPEAVMGMVQNCHDLISSLEHEENVVDPSEPFNRAETLSSLNQEFEQVPFQEIQCGYTALTRTLSRKAKDLEKINNEISAEEKRLEGLTRTIASRLTGAAKEQAQAMAEKKLQDYSLRFEPHLTNLRTESDDLRLRVEVSDESMDLLSRPWYRARDDRPEPVDIGEVTTEVEDEENHEINDVIEPVAKEYIKPKEVTRPGPYAELAKKIPSLTERLERSYSAHQHAYGDLETLQTMFHRITGPNAEKATDQENTALLQARAVLPKFVPDLKNSEGGLRIDHPFFRVYTAEDMQELQVLLRAFSPKERAEFNGLEARVLQTAIMAFDHPEMSVPQELENAIERMHTDNPARHGLQWASLEKYAYLASDAIRKRMRAGGSQNQHLKDYVFNAQDTSGTDPDFTFIYQFIADEFAMNTYAKRVDSGSQVTKSRFAKNCGIITEWLRETEEILSKVPNELSLVKRRRGKKLVRYGKELTYSWSAVASITDLIKDISIRHAGTGDPKVSRHKPANLDPQGALNAQFVLGHMVDELKDRLFSFGAEPDFKSTDIVPLD